jgi:hypothetical protein
MITTIIFKVLNFESLTRVKDECILLGKPKRKRSVGRPGHKWDDTIKMDLREIVCSGMELNSSGSGQKPMEDSCEHVN